jgi:hypothetical protein
MVKFAKLTRVDGQTVYISPKQVTQFYYVEARRETIIVCSAENTGTSVKEDANTVLKALQDAS